MNVRMGLIHKKPDWSSERFSAYWRGHHGALARRAPGLRGYWQNPVTERLQRGIDFARGPWDFDGFSQLWFDDVGKADRAFNDSALAADLIADENHFLGGVHIVTAEQRVVIDLPEREARARLLKRMSILKRRPDLGEEDFRREWKVHGDLMRKMPGVSAYRQNVVIARERVKGQPCGYDDFPIDGIVELWFEDAATLEQAFGSAAGKETMAHARTFLAEITAFVVAERQIL
ncbi:EthD domain-containing protein [Variovorax rhizosphaerae]|uniref:EthD domain-containing protein n=1 Tax=Variovorax rhizosphaerae TaxID=1836200 RepID=A0ABU8WQS6_9BURK